MAAEGEIPVRADTRAMARLRRDLKRIDGVLLDEFAEALKEAVRPVVGDVQAALPKRTGRAARSVRERYTRSTAVLQWGRASVPYLPWLEFGGRLPGARPKRAKALAWPGAPHPVPSTHQRLRARVPDGRYIYPTAKRAEPAVAARIDDAIGALLERLDHDEG